MTGITEFYETLIQWTFTLIDFIVVAMIIYIIWKVDENRNIKILFDSKSRFKKTSLYVCSILFIVLSYTYASDYIQNTLISFFATAMWKTIPAFSAVSSFIIFWISKVVLKRSWELPIVKKSFWILVLSLFLLAF